MKKKKIYGLLFLVCFFSVGITSNQILAQQNQKQYEENWESLAKHEASPEWFRDAKFGIYFHWGIYSVPAFGNEWYPRRMHFVEEKEYKHHLEKYGHPSKFGYHDFIPMFKAENFNAKEWAELFKKAGAKFAGPVAEHHDGYSMWASKVNPWNAKDTGPQRDIVGELGEAIKSLDMKFITTFHHARQLQRYADKPEEKDFRNSHYPFIKGMPPTSTDPKLRLLYGWVPENDWLENIWFGKLKEVIDNYNPDIIWFDSWLDQIPENYLQKFSAYYLNTAASWNKDVVIVRKQNDLPLNFSVNDLEKSRMNRLGDEPWMTDETVSTGSWCYTENLTIKDPKDLTHVLIDIVSKNGVLLLNISPKANGTIPDDQRSVLLKIGNWLDKYGEAIYGTRPWYTYGEGPTKEPEGSFQNRAEFMKIKYSDADVRYSKKGNVIYAFLLGTPDKEKEMVLESFNEGQFKGKVKNVSILGTDNKIAWKLSEKGLHLNVPQICQEEFAVTFKIETEN